MDAALFHKVLTLYGPLVMGWVVAGVLWRSWDQERDKNRDALIKCIQSATESMNSTAATVESMERTLGTVERTVNQAVIQIQAYRDALVAMGHRHNDV